MSKTAPPPAQNPAESIIQPGEDLLYEVSYLGIRLGTVRIHTLRSESSPSSRHHRVMATIDTYEGIPFVDLHAIDSSKMDTAFYSREFTALERKSGRWVKEATSYERDNGRLLIRRSMHLDPRSGPIGDAWFDTLRITGNIHDGLSLFFFARANARNQGEVAVPTVVYGKPGRTKFRFATGHSDEEIAALHDQRIKAVKLEGTAEFNGMYGMTGDFTGWFSDDEASIPIKAELGVFIGTVKIELVGWKRSGWSPPLAMNDN